MSDERPNSLAAQAASWVPPWERTPREPDRAFQARAEAEAAGNDDEPDQADQQPDRPDESDLPGEPGQPGDADGDDETEEAAGRPDPPAHGEPVPPELPPFPGEGDGTATVDAPQELDDEEERDPTDVGPDPELPAPASIEQAEEEEEGVVSVDAPLPPDGDDAGDVFDAAADDDVDDDEVDLPFTEEVPGEDVPGESVLGGDDRDRDLSAVTDPSDGGSEPGAGSDGLDQVGSAELSAPEPVGGTGFDPAAGDPAVGEGAAKGRRRRAAVPQQKGPGAGPGVAGGEDQRRTEEEVKSAPIDDGELRAALEAILLVVDEPVGELQLAQIVEEPAERVARMLEDISARYTAAGHGFDLRRAAGGWRLYTRPEYAAYVERFVLDGQSVRLTQAALETLAVVAYKQPVTRSRISAIRGVNCDGVMRTLVTRGLIEECGTEGETGAYLYRTTVLFLEKLGLNSVDQLPPLAPFLPDDVEEVLDASG